MTGKASSGAGQRWSGRVTRASNALDKVFRGLENGGRPTMLPAATSLEKIMKRWLVCGLVACFGWQGVALAQAGAGAVRVPRVYPQEVKIAKSIERIKDWDKVKGEAKAKKKPIAVVMSEEGTKKGTLEQDTQYALQRARSMGILVYADLKDLKTLPAKVAEAAGGLRDALPAMIFVDPETEDVIVAVKHSKDRNDWEKEIHAAKKTLNGDAPAAKPDGGDKPATDTKKDTKKK